MEMALNGKNIVVCVTGGIAAYKSAALTSKLTKEGAKVQVLMTESATHFVGASTFQALSRNPVYLDTFSEVDQSKIAHIDLADQADLIIVAPATANTIGKMANGIADNMVTTTILATKAPVWVAPAMNVNMFEHPSVQANINTLQSFGYRVFEPGEGLLACGWIGKGRMPEPEELLAEIDDYFSERRTELIGKKVLVTAGATQEKVDPVRYFTNHSSGRMGYAIAESLQRFGAEVTLISGQAEVTPPKGVKVIKVHTADEMYQAVIQHYEDVDAVIKSAAVADYRPKIVYENKLKKGSEPLIIEMERTRDILATLGEKKHHQILIGFAAETENIEHYAQKKLTDKHLDMVVANNLLEEGSGFKGETNRVTFFFADGRKQSLPLQSKAKVAEAICMELIHLLKERQ